MKRILKRETRTPKREFRIPAKITPTKTKPRTQARLTPDASHPKPSPIPLSTINSQPSTSLQNAIAARRKSQTELSDLSNLLAEKSTRQSALEKTGNLHDSAVIAEISRLQIFTSVLPHRIAAKQTAYATAEESLTKTTNEFVQQHLGPRIRKLAVQTREKVETELTPHFRDRTALIVAIAQSQRVRNVEALAWTATSQPAHGAIAHAEGALKAWAAADELEKSVPLEPVSDTGR
jgi:hypothetical protein